MEKEHKIMIEEEMEKAKLDLENELAEIQVRQSHDGGGVGGGRGVLRWRWPNWTLKMSCW